MWLFPDTLRVATGDTSSLDATRGLRTNLPAHLGNHKRVCAPKYLPPGHDPPNQRSPCPALDVGSESSSDAEASSRSRACAECVWRRMEISLRLLVPLHVEHLVPSCQPLQFHLQALASTIAKKFFSKERETEFEFLFHFDSVDECKSYLRIWV